MTLKQFIQLRGIKQLALSKAVGADPATISKFINGWTPLPEKFERRFCEFVGINIEELKAGKVTRRQEDPDDSN